MARLEESFTYYARLNADGHPIYKQIKKVKRAHKHFAGRHVEYEMREVPEEGTDQQLRYFFGVVIRDALIAMRASGSRHIRKSDIYDILVDKFGPDAGEPFVDKDTGQIHYMKKTLSKMSKEERSQFIEQSVEWLEGYFGISIPPPPEKDDEPNSKG
jgi:hypothetical protein